MNWNPEAKNVRVLGLRGAQIVCDVLLLENWHTPALEIVEGALARESTLEFRRLERIADEKQRMPQAAKIRQRAVQFVA